MEIIKLPENILAIFKGTSIDNMAYPHALKLTLNIVKCDDGVLHYAIPKIETFALPTTSKEEQSQQKQEISIEEPDTQVDSPAKITTINPDVRSYYNKIERESIKNYFG